jgi:CheY-like chemotaxis protein
MIFGFVKQTGGHIEVSSKPSVGTEFRLYFPRTQKQVLARPVESRDEHPAARRGETILVVEDNPSLREVVVKQLKGLGYRVIDVSNAQLALDVLEIQGPVDLVFADIMLPGGIDGCTLVSEVMSRWPSVRVLLTSGLPGPHLAKVADLTPKVRLLRKPYRKAKLALTIQEVLAVDLKDGGQASRRVLPSTESPD